MENINVRLYTSSVGDGDFGFVVHDEYYWLSFHMISFTHSGTFGF